jgi:beta-phosphoglucomutase-like phosphatase (HAD superfamily)
VVDDLPGEAQANKPAGQVFINLSNQRGVPIFSGMVPFTDSQLARGKFTAAELLEDFKIKDQFGREVPLLEFDKNDPLGYRILSAAGERNKSLHFTAELPGKSSDGLPRHRLPDGTWIYLDLRNILITRAADGLRLNINVVMCCSDLPDSLTSRYNGAHSIDDLETIALSRLSALLSKNMRSNLDFALRLLPQDYLKALFMESQLSSRTLAERYMRKMLEAALKNSPETFSQGFVVPQQFRNREISLQISIPIYSSQKACSSQSEDASASLQLPVQETSAPLSLQNRVGHLQVIDASQLQTEVCQSRAVRMEDVKAATSHTKPVSAKRPIRIASQHTPIPLPKPDTVKAAIFDLDGVSVNSESAHLKTFNQTLAPLGVQISEKFWKRNYTGTGSTAIMKDVFVRNGINENVQEWVAKRAEVYQKYVEQHGLPEISGFKSFNGYLVSQGVATAVASGGHNSHIQASLQSLGLPKMLFVGQENVSRAKPAPDLFLLAAKRLKVKPSECIVFEDSRAGIEAARRAGMPCIALSTTLLKKEIKGKAALIVPNFKSPVLRKLFARLIRKRR